MPSAIVPAIKKFVQTILVVGGVFLQMKYPLAYCRDQEFVTNTSLAFRYSKIQRVVAYKQKDFFTYGELLCYNDSHITLHGSYPKDPAFWPVSDTVVTPRMAPNGFVEFRMFVSKNSTQGTCMQCANYSFGNRSKFP